MKSLIKYFIRYPINGNILILLIFIFGFFGLKSLKTTFFPSIENRNVTIQVVYPGASPEEIEEGVVLKIENNLKGLSGVERITSTSNENAASIQIEVQKGYEGYTVLQDVKNAVDRISSFPLGMEPPIIFIAEAREFAVSFAVSGDTDLKTLKKAARKIETDLLAIEGISKISIAGFPEEEIEISFREHDIRNYQLSFDQIARAIQMANLNSTGGLIKGENEELLIRAKSKQYYGKDLLDIVVKTTQDGRVVHLGDIAEITDGWEDSPNRVYLNGKPTVIITVSNTIQEDLLTISSLVKDYIEDYNEQNEIVQLTVVRDGAKILNQRINLLVKNGMIGGFLVLIFLTLFLNPRLAFWVALGLPVSFLGMYMIGSLMGLTVNIISLFGMILVVGILVDDAIVIGESIYQLHEKGETPLNAAIKGTMMVLPAVVSAVLTTIVAFSVFFFLEGRMGEFMSDMAFVVIITLVFSLIEGAFILPAHIAHSKAMDKNAKKSKFELKIYGFMIWMRDKLYKPVLIRAIEHKFVTVAVSTALMIIMVGAFKGGIIKTTFFPYIDRDDITITLKMGSGTPDHITEQRMNKLEKAVWMVNEELKSEREDGLNVILNVQKTIGPASEDGRLNISLLSGDERNMESFKITNAVRKKVGQIQGAESLKFGTGGHFGKAVSLSLQSDDFAELDLAKDDLKAELKSLAALKNVNDNDVIGLKEINITLKEKSNLLGITLQDVISQIRRGYFGNEVQRLQRGLDEVRVWVRYEMDERASIGRLENIRIRMNDGREFPLKDIVHFDISRGVQGIDHLDGKRQIRVEADMKNPKESVTEVIAGIKSDIVPQIRQKYPNVRISFEGQSHETAKTGKSAMTVLPIILLLMFTIIAATFRSFFQTVLVYAMIPLGFLGVTMGHLIHGQAISALSAYGIIALIGIMVNDSLVFVTTYNQLLKSGMNVKDAIMETGSSRFRPILLTSMTTIAGLGPLIVEKSLQAQFLIPMAVSVAYGLLVATLVTLIILPVSILISNDIRYKFNTKVLGRDISREELEPAIKEMKVDYE